MIFSILLLAVIVYLAWRVAPREHHDDSPVHGAGQIGLLAAVALFGVDYFTSYFYATGVLTFATSSCPITGNWRFTNDFPGVPTQHLFGEGSFTNVTISGSSLSITISAGNTAFELKGEMASGFYVGFVQWATNDVSMGLYQTGLFRARRW